MLRAHEIDNVVQCCVGDDMLAQLLPHLLEQLEMCQKSLSGYDEMKDLYNIFNLTGRNHCTVYTSFESDTWRRSV